ncbi:hypothetical protein P3T76_007598 [Phytophthora citrophthora]|uniref:CCHC-type domain-containing protein n=1 Tax=Phytophthora citrophthora TaxID=4793 RepID=A0AAD9GLS4_9STRA|nr:hypothetical protein P3T76_007598 [Phytophthora citrophthora]
MDALRSPVGMAQRRSRAAERPSPNPRPRQQSRMNAPSEDEASRQSAEAPTDSATSAAPNAQASVPDTMSMQQMLVFITQQQQAAQAQLQAQFQAQMQQANARFEFLVSSRSDQKKKDPPMYEGKYGEHIELWIFATEQYYASRRELMEADSSDFVTMISSNLGKSYILRGRFSSDNFAHVFDQRTSSMIFERMFRLKQRENIHDYVSKFQDLLSQTELSISELEKRFFFQNGLREETAKKIKEESPSTLQEAIEIASNFEFAHFSGRPPRTPAKPSQALSDSGNRAPKSKQQNTKRFEKKSKNDDWTKTATCRNCDKVGHISPQCTQPKRKEANRYVKGAVYAILEAEARAFKTEDQERPVTIFIDNGSSLNGVTEELVKKLDLDVTEGDMMQVDLGYDQVVYRPRRTVEMSLQLPGFPLSSGTFQVMPVPEGKDVVLGMMTRSTTYQNGEHSGCNVETAKEPPCKMGSRTTPRKGSAEP